MIWKKHLLLSSFYRNHLLPTQGYNKEAKQSRQIIKRQNSADEALIQQAIQNHSTSC